LHHRVSITLVESLYWIQEVEGMNWGRKFAPIIVAVLVFWTAIPALLCLPGMHPTPNHSCCVAMSNDCPSTTMDASSPCCQLEGQSNALPQVSQDFLDHSPRVAILAHLDTLLVLNSFAGRFQNTQEAPPPQSSSGSSSALRI
jgi:hypothetical protein